MVYVTVDKGIIDKAFQDNPVLRERVFNAISEHPGFVELFEDIALYTVGLRNRTTSPATTLQPTAPPQQGCGQPPAMYQQTLVQQQQPQPVIHHPAIPPPHPITYQPVAHQPKHPQSYPETDPQHRMENRLVIEEPREAGPAVKKRKMADGSVSNSSSSQASGLSADAELQFYVQETSFSVPQRKKLTLEVTRETTTSPWKSGYLRARNPASREVEFGVPLSQIRYVLCLPVPDKPQRQFNFCIIPRYADGITSAPTGETIFDPIVWTVPDGPPRTAFLGTGTPAMESASLAETYETYLQSALNARLSQTKVACADAKEFFSPIPVAHRKGEKAYHVKAFRGNKEGYLYFLSTGIFFGFKRPLLFFALENIDSISYMSVLQRTFNLVIATSSLPDSSRSQEFEFAMIDQANYPAIDAYVKKHRLQDASMAEARRAKRLNVNGIRGEDHDDDARAEEEEESELQKAQRALEEEEDDEEEDFDPGSDGYSDGSDSTSEEEDDGGHWNAQSVEGRDLVQEELGSEAEDVED